MATHEEFWVLLAELSDVIDQNIEDGETSAAFCADFDTLAPVARQACISQLDTVLTTLQHVSRRVGGRASGVTAVADGMPEACAMNSNAPKPR